MVGKFLTSFLKKLELQLFYHNDEPHSIIFVVYYCIVHVMYHLSLVSRVRWGGGGGGGLLHVHAITT